MKYKVIWDNGNGHACGEFPGEYETVEAATEAGKSWVSEMEAIDPEGRGQYEFEVIGAP